MTPSTATSPFERLKAYLPDTLAEKVGDNISKEDALSICGQLSSLRAVLSTYLPRSLVHQIGEDPRPDLLRASFMEGSALFADVSGFTAMSEKLSVLGKEGAEEITSIVNDYFETMLTISDRYGGDLLKFGGDALLLFFEGQEGPAQAVNVAIEMQDAMSQYQQVKTSQGTFPLRMSIGIGSGEIFITNVGSSDEKNYAVMGSALVNMSKAEDEATAGEIIVDRMTRDATMEIASFAPKGENLWLFLSTSSSVANPWKSVKLQDPASALMGANVPEILEVCFGNLSFIEGLTPYVPDELTKRLIPDPSRPILYGSHRPVTVMFSNFIGIDDLVDALGKDHLEDICNIMNTYYVRMSGIISQYGGIISRVDSYVVGQRILALFGALRAHEDDPQRAIRAGLEMNSALDEVNHKVVEILDAIPDLQLDYDDRPIRQRIGINSGFVFAGNMGSSARREYTVMGDQVNLTARIMSVSEEGDVLIGQSTARQVENDFQLDERAAVKVKGKTDPVRNFIVQGMVEKVAKEVATPSSPIIGREEELEQAQATIDKVVQGDGRVLTISGPSGIGKTRLVEEIITLGSSAGMNLLVGTCLSYGDTLTYHPWAEILRTLFGIQPSDAPQNRISAVERGLEAVGETDWAPVIGTVLGLEIPDNELTRDLDAKLRRQRVLDLVVKILQVHAASKPLMMIVEDAHWADSASMDLIDYVTRNIHEDPILFILPHRPDEGVPDWTAFPHAVGLNLLDLSEGAILGIVESMIGPVSIPDGTRDLILSRASGNPFFVGEVIRALMDAGVFQQDASGKWEFVETEVAIELPDTIHGIVISRIDRLEPSDRRILQTASVVGRTFDYETLSGVSQGNGGIPAKLDSMQNLGLIEVLNRQNGEYRFIHLTTREVVYESLSYGLRRNLHSQIGEFVELTYADSLSERIDLLAYHYYQGHAWAKALPYNLQAGERAKTEFANDIAITSFEHALEATEALGEDEDVSKEKETAHESLGDVLTIVGRYSDALNHFDLARDIVKVDAGSDSKSHLLAELYRKTADVFERQSEYETALNWLVRGLEALSDEQKSVEAARIYLMGAGIYHRQAKNDEAFRWCQKALETTKELASRESKHVTAHTLYLQGTVQNRLGRLEEALRSCEESVGIFEQIEDFLGQARSYNNLSIAYSDLGDWVNATDAANKSLSINQRIGNIQEQGFIANNLGNIHMYRGNYDRAIELMQESNAIWKKIGAKLPDAVTLSNMAQVFINQGDLPNAKENLAQAQALFEGIGSEDFLHELERRWAEYYLKSGDTQNALEHINRSVELATEIDAQFELGMSLRILGKIQATRGDFKIAKISLERSLKILTELESEYEIAKTKLAISQLEINSLGKTGDNEKLAEAIMTFKRLGAEADLKLARQLEKGH